MNTLRAASVAASPPVSPLPNVRRVREPEFVRAIDAWLRGADWTLSDARFAPYHGLSIRLQQQGETLALKGVPILSRSPPGLLPLPLDIPDGATARFEAQALCAVALRGDAGRYREPILPEQHGRLAAA